MGYEFMGFHRPDGRVGARNLVGVIPSVTCANDVAQAIVTEVHLSYSFTARTATPSGMTTTLASFPFIR